jgi:hypothetical protein
MTSSRARSRTLQPALGDVTYMIDPSLLKLPHGRHTVTLSGMLLTETTHFTS